VLLPRGDGVAFLQASLINRIEVFHTASQIEHSHLRLVINESEQVAVTRHDVHRPALGTRPGSEGADNVVRLIPSNADAGKTNRGQKLADHLNLMWQSFRDVLATRIRVNTVSLIGRNSAHPKFGTPVVI